MSEVSPINHKNLMAKRLIFDLNVLYETKIDSDVVLVARNQDFSAHKAILTARSKVFAAMFDNQMRENNENKVEVPDIKPEVLELILRYIYTGNVTEMNQIGDELMTVANKFGLKELKDFCVDYWQQLKINDSIKGNIRLESAEVIPFVETISRVSYPSDTTYINGLPWSVLF